MFFCARPDWPSDKQGGQSDGGMPVSAYFKNQGICLSANRSFTSIRSLGSKLPLMSLAFLSEYVMKMDQAIFLALLAAGGCGRQGALFAIGNAKGLSRS